MFRTATLAAGDTPTRSTTRSRSGSTRTANGSRSPSCTATCWSEANPAPANLSLLNTIIAHTAFCPDARLVLIDGKVVEFGLWREAAQVFVGNNPADALTALRNLQQVMNDRYHLLERNRRRKITPGDGLPAIVCVIDELAYFSVTVGTPQEQDDFKTLVRDLVARGRAAGVIVIAATQRPSADIIPTCLRDLFSYRVAFRCTTDSS